MKKYCLQTQTLTFLILFVFFTSCNGQVKTTTTSNNISEQKTITTEHPKLIKTQGSNPSDNIRCGLQDKEGNLWFGTTGEGVYQYDGKLFTQFTIIDGLNGNTVWSIIEDKNGTIWIGTNNGLCKYDGKVFSKVPLTNSKSLFVNDESSINEVFSIMQDKEGMLWFGTTDGVYRFDGNAFSSFLSNNAIANKNGLTLKSVQCMMEDSEGNIWFGSGPMAFEGLCLYDGKTLTNFKLNGDEGWIRNLLEDRNGIIWIGTRHYGVWRYDSKDFSQFMEGKYGSGVASLEDKKGNMWFSGSENQNTVESTEGIWRYDGNSFTNYNTEDGFSKYSVWDIIEDRDGNIWIGTRNNGLYKYDEKKFTSFSE